MSVTDTSPPIALHPSSPAVIRFGSFRFDRGNRILSRDGVELTLPPRALAVLEFLLDRRGKVVSKQSLIDSVWNGTFVTETSLSEAISILRQTLEDDSQDPRFIQTLHRRGYRFIAPVTLEPEPGLRVTPAGAEQRKKRMLPIAAGAVVLSLALAGALWLRAPASAPRLQDPLHLSVALPPGAELIPWIPSLAISPDGQDLVFVAEEGEKRFLYHRPLKSPDAVRIKGTGEGMSPFFSPDGRFVAFFADGKLKKVPLSGGSPVVLLDTAKARSGTWCGDGSMILSMGIPGGLGRYTEATGKLEVLTTADASRGEVAHFWPHLLPDGDHVLFTAWSNTFDSATIELLSLRDRQRRTIVRGGSWPMVAPSGHLLFVQRGSLLAAPFDPSRGLTGPARVVADRVQADPFTGMAQAVMARSGDLFYMPGGPELAARDLVWTDTSGRDTIIPAPPRLYRNAKVSPDGTRLAVTVLEGGRSDVWAVNVRDGSMTRLTFDGFNIEPVWSPDGEWVAFSSNRSGAYNIYRRSARGDSELQRLNVSTHHQFPYSWSRSSEDVILFGEAGKGGFDLFMLRGDGSSWKAEPFSASGAEELSGDLSPDGRWVVFSSNDAGEWKIFLRPRTGAGRWQVSLDRGYMPFWSTDGTKIYYDGEDGVMAVPVRLQPSVEIGKAVRVMKREDIEHIHAAPGGRFIAIREREENPKPRQLNMILNPGALLE